MFWGQRILYILIFCFIKPRLTFSHLHWWRVSHIWMLFIGTKLSSGVIERWRGLALLVQHMMMSGISVWVCWIFVLIVRVVGSCSRSRIGRSRLLHSQQFFEIGWPRVFVHGPDPASHRLQINRLKQVLTIAKRDQLEDVFTFGIVVGHVDLWALEVDRICVYWWWYHHVVLLLFTQEESATLLQNGPCWSPRSIRRPFAVPGHYFTV